MSLDQVVRTRAGATQPPGHLTIRVATKDDHDALNTLISQATAKTTWARFRTGVGTEPPQRLVSHLLMTHGGGEAHLAFEHGALVGHAMWAAVEPDQPQGATAEVAIMVADGHQRRGIGTELGRGLLTRLQAAGITRIQVTTGVENRVVIDTILRRWPGVRPRRERTDLTFDLPIEAAVSGSLRPRPPVGSVDDDLTGSCELSVGDHATLSELTLSFAPAPRRRSRCADG
ncbi:GNAT family N-acetyltransferase [Aeromicrobium sp. CTD01-1L150]|uniref:GNAT family N-acetyltransferase n=1 Tax=Aeromicrobium sp. CTD01-1L150 TaxID=3341830 RepID=UPI0035BF32FD